MSKHKYEGSCDPFDKDFNWFLFFEQPVEDISYDALVKAENLASNWVTCACGQLCKALPRGTSNNPDEPKDPKLSELGYKFYDEIEKARDCKKLNAPALVKVYLANAEEILIQIEQRTTELLLK
jgi:hypothetical protein